MIPDQVYKTCSTCENIKPLDSFYKKCKKCKVCTIATVKANRNANLKSIQEYDRQRKKQGNMTPLEWETKNARSRKCNMSELQKLARANTCSKHRKNNKDKIRETTRVYREKNPKKFSAHTKVGIAIKTGILTSSVCEVCGEAKVHGHHADYDKPLEVMWLCSEHHVAWHTANGEGANAHY